MKAILTITVLALLALTFPLNAAANSITYSGSGSGLSASANFNLTGNTLQVTLSNTSMGDAANATYILLGVLFNTNTTLTPQSASLPVGTTAYGSYTNVGLGWEYLSGISAQGMNSGISGAGYGIFGQSNFDPGFSQNLQGSDYGIAPIGYTNTGNASIKDPIFQNSILFTLNAPNFSLSELGDSVVFQYGTSLDEPSITVHRLTTTPEPSTFYLFGAGALGIIGLLRRRLA